MNQNFSKSKMIQKSFKFEHFHWGWGGGGVKNFRGTNLRGKDFGPLKCLGFQQVSYL